MSPTVADVLIASLFAGAVAIGVTVAIERWGGRIGGLIATLPSTIVPASLGIYAQSSTSDAFVEAMDLVPAGMLLNVLFLLSWRLVPRLLPRMRVGAIVLTTTGISLSIWLALAFFVVWGSRAWVSAGSSTLTWAVMATVLLVSLGIAGTWARRRTPAGKRAVPPGLLLLRGVFAATAIGACVVVAGLGNSLLAGVVAVFPAIYLTTMASVWLSQGRAVQAGAVGPMMLGSASIAAYALWARTLMPELGPGPGAAISWLAATFCATLPAWLWLREPT